MNAHKLKKYSKRFLLYTILLLIATSFILPFFWMVASSLKTPDRIFDTSFSLIPRDSEGNISITFENYRYAFGYLQMHILFANTLIVATVATVANLFLNSLAGYAFARIEFKGRDAIFKIILLAMMIPGTVMLVPNLIIINRMGLYDTLVAIFIPFVMSIYNVFLMRQTFMSLSKDLEESAFIDGASRLKVFFKIAMPLAKPTLIVLAITTFMWNYNNFIWPLVVTTSEDTQTLAVGLGSLIAAGSSNPELYPAMIAGSVITSIPLIILFLFFQRYIVKGISIGGVKA